MRPLNVQAAATLLRVVADQEEALGAALARGEEADHCGTNEWMSDVICDARRALPGYDWDAACPFVCLFLRTILPQLPLSSEYVS